MRNENRGVSQCRSSRTHVDDEGRYSNYFEVGHNKFEFVIDFGQFYNDDKEVRMHTRIITNPAYLKTLLELLSNSKEEYEQKYGVLK